MADYESSRIDAPIVEKARRVAEARNAEAEAKLMRERAEEDLARELAKSQEPTNDLEAEQRSKLATEVSSGQATSRRVAILIFLKSVHPRMATPLEIADAIKSDSPDAVRVVLNTLEEGGYVEKPKRGFWRVRPQALVVEEPEAKAEAKTVVATEAAAQEPKDRMGEAGTAE